MNAHLANEARYDILRHPGRRTGLMHLLIPDECLSAAGVPTAALMCADQRAHNTPSGFEVMTQAREHATGECLPWESAFASYIPSDALGEVLAPEIPAHPRLAPRVASGGALFVSVPVLRDEHGRYDPYATTAVRVAWGETSASSRVVLFSHGELVPRNTRYTADRQRLARLCRHFCRYVAVLGGAAPKVAVDAAAHIAMGLDGAAAEAPPGEEPPIAPEEQLTAPGGADATDEEESVSGENEEILELVRRAALDAASRLPVRAAARPGVASGLRQGALMQMASGTAGGSELGDEAVLAGLEAPGRGRFATTGANRGSVGDVLTLAPGGGRPRSLIEWLDAGWTALAGEDRPGWLWSRRPISIVQRHHYATQKRFVVISYDGSVAWGGRRLRGPALSSELADELVEACAAEEVLDPRQLSAVRANDLVARFPILERPMRMPHPPLPPFNIAGEVALAHRIRTACLEALGSAVRAALQGSPHIAQRIRYEFSEDQRGWLAEVSRRLPAMLEGALRAVEGESVDRFLASAYALSVLFHLGYCAGRGRRAVSLGGDFPAAAAESDAVYAFDYYGVSGEVRRVSDRPIAVLVEGDVIRTQCKCRFMERPQNTANTRVCARYLPGESYAYICLGFNRRLHALVVFPGGFAFAANVSAYLTLPPAVSNAAIQRYCLGVRAGCDRVR
ncbi:DNA packaging tegument protein UL17 [Bovine alphaherpesvirus 2]|uniref:DNA packaging tegument protein UL17 n=1 Tax=Bovine alphaherpesvirus 2 TaxID=10295 RepID=A0ABX6WPF1_9ALPH|nr:DNA packaging tegument protein UL17 [Bovine alphaherpesvirus 2]QPO25150.1 DNA packaging tegument protein UL17 [Bovine alphaherpesvirus 2]